MSPIAPETVYTKTAKGVLEIRNKTVRLPRELGLVFLSVDGKATVGDLLPRSGMTGPQFQHALTALVTDGYIRVVAAGGGTAVTTDGSELEFMSSRSIAKLTMEAASRALAETEAFKRAESEGRAAAEARARQAHEEAEAHAQAELKAQARASAEAGAREACEALLQAIQGARAYADQLRSPEADAARARVRELEEAAGFAREEARALAEAEGRAHEEPQPEFDIADRVRQLNAKVQAVRQQRVDVNRAAPEIESVAYNPVETVELPHGDWPSLPVAGGEAAAPAVQPELTSEALPEIRIEPQTGSAATVETNDLPVVDLDRATPPPPPHPEQHLETALERAMAQQAARAQAAAEQKPVQPARPVEAVKPVETARTVEPAQPAEPATPVELAIVDDQEVAAQMRRLPEPEPEPPDANAPTIDDDDPLHERLNVDRTAHDLIAETAAARRKADATALTSTAADGRRQKKDEETRREAVFARSKRRKRTMVFGVVGVLVVLGAAIAWLQFSPLNGYIPSAQQALAERLNQPVTITSLRYVLLPTPRLVLEGVAIGQAEGVRAKRVDAHALPFTLFGEPKRFDTVEAEGVTINPSMLGTIPAWTGGRTASAVHVDRLRLTDVKLDIPKSDLGSFNGDVTFERNGTLKQALVGNDKMKLELAPVSDGVRATLEATNWKLPFGAGVEFDYVTVKGMLSQAQMSVGEFTGRFAGGALRGTINAKWSGPITIEGEFNLDNAQLRDLSRELMPALEGKGTVKVAGRYTMQAPTMAAAVTNPQVEATFSVVRGELTNIDLVRGIQSPGAAAFRGGRTGFEELAGTLQIANGRYVYRQVQLKSGPLNATASLEVSPSSELTGRLNAELASKGGVVARQALAIGGTAKDPQLKR